ncbi:hypothetical protein D9M70_432110 [compost metagenome]
MVLEFLEARTFFPQVPTQGLRAGVQVLRHRVQVRPGAAVAAEQATDLAGQAVAAIGAGQQVGRGMFEEMLEGALVLQQRHGQVAGMEAQADARSVEAAVAGKQQLVLAGMGRLGVAEGGLLQADALADQPAAQAMPDHQQAFHQEVVRVLEQGVVHRQYGEFAVARQGDARRIGEQSIEEGAPAEGLFQGPAMDDGVAHHGEGAALAGLLAEAHVFVVQRFPEHLQKPGELLGRHPCAGFVQQGRLDAGGAQDGHEIHALAGGAAQGGTDEMAGDGALAHGAVPWSGEADGRSLAKAATRAQVAEIPPGAWRKSAREGLRGIFMLLLIC